GAAGNRRGNFPPQSARRFREEGRGEYQWEARVQLVPSLEVPAGAGRGGEHQGGCPSGMLRGKAQRRDASERDAADDRPLDTAAVERGSNLVREIVHASGSVNARTAQFAAERERDDTKRPGKCVDRGREILPAARKAGHEDERSA